MWVLAVRGQHPQATIEPGPYKARGESYASNVRLQARSLVLLGTAVDGVVALALPS